MAGPNMELFRFALYLAFPLGFMVYFGDPAWYDKYVIPIRERYVPPETDFRQPKSREELQELLAKKRGNAPHSTSAPLHPELARSLAAWSNADDARLV
ncbi:hypothetical protein MVES1_003663 [Malassezia vespertilionis]|uniref:Uncharacterized protein n=1 Tax=Malassezia vespertilionis TaxID=2020962 RepID=A0A2N1J8F6_9BASI|nr:uncharacterized protein MVES1_003663 [Malassezia vespertilionis]PKI82836.1 hypothetical protein MVES_003226 [Malassezia vespertilionis]WFD08291.1 hypothetical protein MVES1_003663 [Malassezia vespertilionis]